MIHKDNTEIKLLKNLSPQDFLSLGVHDIAYVREIDVDGKASYAVHAADGTPLSVLKSLNEALHIIEHNDLETAILH